MSANRSLHDSGTGPLIERQMILTSLRKKMQRREKPPAGAAEKYRFITISRDVGSSGDLIASNLARRLHWDVYDKEIVDHIAKDGRVHQDLVNQLDEKSQGLIHDSVRRLLEMIEGGALGAEDYQRALLKVLMLLVSRGKSILMGRGANFVLGQQPGLKIRILGSLDVRTERLSKKWEVAPAEARRRILGTDKEKKLFIRRYYGKDIDDARFYDVVINTDHLSPDQAVDMLVAAIHGSAGIHPAPTDLTR